MALLQVLLKKIINHGVPQMTSTNHRADKIVIVDDDARIRDLLRRYLHKKALK
jgi:PleD family two-component response regulator